MSAKFTSLIWSADLDRPLKFIALVLADSADPHGIVSSDDKKMFAWLTGYTVPELDKVIAKLIKTGILVQMSENRLRFSADHITPLTPYWKDMTIVDDAAIAQLNYQLSSLHISTELVEEILQNHTAALITAWLELYEQAVEVGLADGSGYLVSALKRNWNIEDAKERIEAKRRQIAKQSPDLPDELMDLLQSLDWQDDLGEISVCYNEDPDRTLAWAVHAKKQGWKAGRFRKSLRSKLYPPNKETSYETVLMPTILTMVNSAESSTQDDWPEPSEEAVNAWQECLKQIAQMPDAERGFNGGEFASWLKPAQPISIECTGLDNVFTVKSCNKTAAQWIAETARGTVEDVLQSVLDRSINLESIS